ncbi:MAG: glutaredoxin 3 [Bdellovibrionales bacterium]|nr:glutaredoxin 3 [Bdellovibrionales bacterium]
MAKVTIYSKTYCPFCVRAKSLLESKGADFEEIMVEKASAFAELKERTSMRTVPQIFINDELIGGYTELAALDEEGRLDELLKS